MGTEDRVDVIISTFNRPTLVQRAVRSVLAQTHQNVSIIVVDDASETDTERVLHEHRNRIDLLMHSQNRGAPAARNTGLERAQSPYVAFLDDDDEYEPTKLERQLELLRSAPPSVIGVDAGSRLVAEGRSATIGASMGSDGRRGLLRHAVRGSMTSTVLYRRSCLEGVTFDENLPAYQEYDFLLRATRGGTILPLNEPLVRVHDHDGPRVTNPEAHLRAMEALRKKHGSEIESDERAIFVWHRKLGRLNLRLGRPREAREHFRVAATSTAAPAWFKTVAAVPACALPTVWTAAVTAARLRDVVTRWRESSGMQR